MVEDWFDSFRDRLRSRVRDPKGGPWPEDDDEWWEGVLAWMNRARVRSEEGDALLDLVQEHGLRGSDRGSIGHIDATIPALKKYLREHRAGRAEGDAEREAASRRCRESGCECGGMGLVSRDHYKPDYGGYAVSYYCPGPMGRLVEEAHRRKKLTTLAHVAGSGLELDPKAPPDPVHHRIGRWFVARGRAAAEGRPLPPPPPEVVQIEREYRERNRPADRPRPPAPAPAASTPQDEPTEDRP